MTEYLAHIENTSGRVEPLEEHLRLVAQGNDALPSASGYAAAFGAGQIGELLGWWHDLGKHSNAFQRYLRASAGLGEHAGGLLQRLTEGRV